MRESAVRMKALSSTMSTLIRDLLASLFIPGR
jgi:hypothetical protein